MAQYKSTRLLQPLITAVLLPLSLILRSSQRLNRAWRRLSLYLAGISTHTTGVEEEQFPPLDHFERTITRLKESGLRSTAGQAHERFMTWVKEELTAIPGLSVTLDEYQILRWQPVKELSLKQAGSLVLNDGRSKTRIDIAGAVPYSKPSPGSTGQLVYVQRNQSLLSNSLKGKIVLREVSDKSLPMIFARIPAYSTTSDLDSESSASYIRPSFWEIPMHQDLIDAGNSDAAGVVFIVDLPRVQIESYWDPHQGTHYGIPAVFCAAEDITTLQTALLSGREATIAVHAEVSVATTSNIYATLPGQIEETIVYSTHTDGNTCVQDNGVGALLALASYFACRPVSSRRRTLQFAFNTAHLHVSKEGSGRHAQQLDSAYDKNSEVALVIPVEHLGTRELEARPNPSGIGRILEYTGRGEPMIWCVGPSAPLVSAVEEAVKRRGLDSVLITRGVGLPRYSKVPMYTSFGGLGTLYHNALLPTTSLISGPWSLFAPSFGAAAVDIGRMRAQTLALGDVYLATERLSRTEIAGGYLKYRERRQREGKKVYDGFVYPAETLSGHGQDTVTP